MLCVYFSGKVLKDMKTFTVNNPGKGVKLITGIVDKRKK